MNARLATVTECENVSVTDETVTTLAGDWGADYRYPLYSFGKGCYSTMLGDLN